AARAPRAAEPRCGPRGARSLRSLRSSDGRGPRRPGWRLWRRPSARLGGAGASRGGAALWPSGGSLAAPATLFRWPRAPMAAAPSLRAARCARSAAVPTIRYLWRATWILIVDVHPGVDLLAIGEPNPDVCPREKAARRIDGVEPFVGVDC